MLMCSQTIRASNMCSSRKS
ncbi:hypothetical protein MTR67_027627 [Solanum verrucosum]|uniref:Uncharacterized protein n=1 Tax=Solanum verrucosum TaxID=315347 RepID=A0AAF0R112_SOLVR|nr:hypothetical protein MTR67_027627 [Solanum verrucosum]